jgi:uncharacterized protein
MTKNEELPTKAAKLNGILQGVSVGETVNIAYSGGLDSRFLSFFALSRGLKVNLLHVTGPHIASDETEEAISAARKMGLEPQLVPINPLENPLIQQAGRNRCYECKKTIFSILLERVSPALLCDGTNASDLLIFRPGRKALEELGIRSPLAEAGITKEEIRALGREISFPNPEQAARPCLLTRFPYGVLPNEDMLRAIARIERFIADHPFGKTLRFRVRVPDSDGPQLHVERSSLPERPFERISKLQHDLRDEFPNLKGMPVEIFETLSGYYDNRKQ